MTDVHACAACGQPMREGGGCAVETFEDFADGIPRRRVRYGDEFRDWKPELACHDCAVAPGEFHHVGCDVERCPRCGGQAITCECIENAEPVAAWEPESWLWYCHDCRVDCSAANENYMVRDELWPEELAEDVLCVGCLERRLGRRLRREDFDRQGSWTEGPLSARLAERLRGDEP